jgi:hypothetical protein
MAAAETVGLAFPQHYLWWFPGSPVKVHLALGVVQRLKRRLSGRAPNSEEGLLFGGTREGVTEILDFQPATKTSVASMIAGLTAERRRSLVGYYRTEDGDALRLSAQDLALANECFAKPYNVFLMIHRSRFGPPTATFFFHDRDCRMADFAFLEFPFDPTLLAAEQHDRMQRSQHAMEGPIALPAPVPVSAHAGEVRRMERRVAFRAVGWICALALVFSLGVLVNNDSFRQRSSYIWRAISTPTPTNAAPASAPQAPSRPSLSLHAIRRGADLELTWNRDSALIADAISGTLSIQDGESTRLVPFDAAQLQDGSLLYSPRADQILMRLTVTTPNASATESVTVILPKGESHSPTVTVSPAPHRGDSSIKLSRTFTGPLLAKDIAPVTSIPRDPPALDGYEPPVAVVKPQPVFPADLSSLMVKRTVVDVRVTIDKNGKVIKAESIPQENISSYWLNSAVDAARLWKFKPAQSNHEPVWSEAILQFVFNR